MNRNGALAGVLVGSITIVVWKQLSGGIFDLYEIVPGFILASISIVLVSLMTASNDEIETTFDEYEKKLDTMA
jgi:sodium/proline symporter